VTDQTAEGFIPPAAQGLPAGTLEAAEIGANRLDAWARTPQGRNFLAHALVQLARTGWLRQEPGDGFEPMADRPPAEPAADRAAPAVWVDGHPQLEAIAAAVWEQCGRSDSGMCVEDDPRNIAVAALAAVLPAPTDRAAVLREAADALDNSERLRDLTDDHMLDINAAADELRRMADEAQQDGEAPGETLDLTDGPVRCPLCPHPVTLHTPNGARAHFTTVHPEQRTTGRGPGPWPLLVTNEDEAQQGGPQS
jgi:hypothetical protein